MTAALTGQQSALYRASPHTMGLAEETPAMHSLSYYPGCSLHGTAQEYDHSLKLVATRLGIQLEELNDWTCCGATAAHSTDELLALVLPARNLLLAAANERPLLAPCAMCFNRMRVAQHEVQSEGSPAVLAELLGETGNGWARSLTQVKVISLLDLFTQPSVAERIAEAIVRPLEGLQVACYYGCLLVRPPSILRPDSAENPQAMDQLVRSLGAEAIDWPFKTECCGGSLALTRSEIMLTLSRQLLRMATQLGADCIVTACPMCHSNLDTRQGQIRRRFAETYDMPILYVSELVGLALGFSPQELWLDKHMTKVNRVASRVASARTVAGRGPTLH